MSKFKRIGLNILFCVAGIVCIPMVILLAIVVLLVYGCFSIFEYVTSELSDEDIDKEWDELCDSYGKFFECCRDMILDLKMEL